MGRRRATDRHGRRTLLVDAAVACIRREGPDASMADIAAEAGVTKPILYRHFRDKADLEDAIAARFTETIATQLRRTMRRSDHPRAVLRASVDSYVRLVERETNIYRFLVHRGRPSISIEGEIEHFMRRLGDEIGLVLGEAMRELGLDSGPAEVWGHGIVGMVSASVDRWVERRVLPQSRLVEYLTDLAWTGLNGATRSAAAVPATGRPPADVVPMRRTRS